MLEYLSALFVGFFNPFLVFLFSFNTTVYVVVTTDIVNTY